MHQGIFFGQSLFTFDHFTGVQFLSEEQSSHGFDLPVLFSACTSIAGFFTAKFKMPFISTKLAIIFGIGVPCNKGVSCYPREAIYSRSMVIPRVNSINYFGFGQSQLSLLFGSASGTATFGQNLCSR